MLCKNGLLFLFLLFCITAQAQTIVATKSGDWSSDTTWNLNRIPNSLDDVLIDGFTVDISTNARAKTVEVNCSSGSSFLEMDGSDNILEINGDLKIINENLGTIKEARVHIFGQDSMYVAGQLLFERMADATSSGKCKLWMTSQSKLHVANGLNYNYRTSGALDDKWEIYLQDTVFVRIDGGMNFNISGGEILNMKIIDDAVLRSNGDLNLTMTGGNGLQFVVCKNGLLDIDGNVNIDNQNTKNPAVVAELATTIDGGNIKISNNLNIKSSIADQIAAVNILGDTTLLDVRGNITFHATTERDAILNVENKAKVFLGGNLFRQNDLGSVAMSDSSELILDGAIQQILPENPTQATSTDSFQISNIKLNNQSGNGYILAGPFEVEKELALVSGIVEATAAAPVILKDGAITSGGSVNAYIDGPVIKEGAVAGDGFTFPLGNNGVFAPLSITVPKSAADDIEYSAKYLTCPPPLGSTLGSALVTISGTGHWEFSRSETSPDVDVTLHWDNANAQGIIDLADLRVAAYHPDSTKWFSLGNGGTTGSIGNNSGSIINGLVCPPPLGSTMFTFGSEAGTNPLPVVLSDFQAQAQGEVVVVKWETEAASNADFFSLERSRNGLNFKEIERVNAINTIDRTVHYNEQDLNPEKGINYYRLCLIDYMGMKVYSRIIPVSFDSAGEIQAFPNPASEILNIKGDFNVRAYPIEIYSATGRLLHRETILGKKGFLQIDIQNMHLTETGMMYLQITNKGLLQTIPFVKT